jgi:uncharacterized repeat protein (TIGR02543 family)
MVDDRCNAKARPRLGAMLFLLCGMLTSAISFAQPSTAKVTVTPPGVEGQIGGSGGAGGSSIACGQVCLNCGRQNACSMVVTRDTQVTLTAHTNTGYSVKSWTGACAGQTGRSCTFKADKDVTVGLEFSGGTASLATLTAKPAAGGTIGTSEMACTARAPQFCTGKFVPNTRVSVSATPDTGYAFAGWGDACAGQTGSSCTLTPTGNVTVSATFKSIGTAKVTVTPPGVEGQIGGSGGSGGSSIACGQVCLNCGRQNACSMVVSKGTQVTLTAHTNTGYSVKSWTGACAGQTGRSCSFKADADSTVGLEFSGGTANLATLTAKPAVGGTIGSSEMACTARAPQFCTGKFVPNTRVGVSATPDTGYVFAGWGDACAGQTGTSCTLTPTGNVTVSATFKPK